MDGIETLRKVAERFEDPSFCEDYLRHLRWQGGKPTCPRCHGTQIGEIATRGLHRCRSCRRQFSTRVGTIFEDSPLTLRQWFVCVFVVANDMPITSKQLADLLGVTLRTAWFMAHKIRCAIKIA